MTYAELETELNITPAVVEKFHCMKTVSVPSADLIIAPSSIEGMGVVTQTPRYVEEYIAVAVLNGDRTAYGRYLNHSDDPNAYVGVGPGYEMYIIMSRAVPKDTEVTIDYRIILEGGLNDNVEL
jgi:hypothetical protein